MLNVQFLLSFLIYVLCLLSEQSRAEKSSGHCQLPVRAVQQAAIAIKRPLTDPVNSKLHFVGQRQKRTFADEMDGRNDFIGHTCLWNVRLCGRLDELVTS